MRRGGEREEGRPGFSGGVHGDGALSGRGGSCGCGWKAWEVSSGWGGVGNVEGELYVDLPFFDLHRGRRDVWT